MSVKRVLARALAILTVSFTMRPQTLFSITVVLIVAIAVVNALALAWGLYWRWLWLDIPMHFLGGFWIALFSVWLLRFSHTPVARKGIPLSVSTIGSAFLVGLVWEGYEIAIGAVSFFDPYLADTLLDLALDVSGGFLAWGMARFVDETPSQP